MDALLTSPGRYVVAVSGGVDSMALLHALHAAGRYELVVAHLDHGIRPDSAEDRHLVELAAKRSGLPFVYAQARLGPGTSEAAAREARYTFLSDTRREYSAAAVVTAHHQDDALETAVINLLRGTGRKGLTALAARDGLERPLLHVPKREILDYAREHGLQWREDSTNDDTDYLRNYVRHRLLPRLDPAARERLLEIVSGLRATNTEIAELLAGWLAEQGDAGRSGKIDRAWFVQLPHEVARETIAAWLRGHGVRDFDRTALERLVVAAKTAAPGKTFDVRRGIRMRVGAKDLALTGAER
jgi:tRNA(Ile)-lysidine synthetase-like protein